MQQLCVQYCGVSERKTEKHFVIPFEKTEKENR